MTNREFQELVWQKGRELYRDMPWRRDTRPYYVLVSELMLQQTQVARVLPKFEAFIAAFPNEQALAQAPLADVLRLWQGLGYNRRAKYLHDAAKMIVGEWGGNWAQTEQGLMRLPGVGSNTAGALMAYVYNKHTVFIETNIRTVYFLHYFDSRDDVSDKELRAVVERTIDQEHPREFYWALMDFGAWLKASGVRNIASSKHYKKQAPLKGSVREMRGRIVKVLTEGDVGKQQLQKAVQADERFATALEGLMQDGLVIQRGSTLCLVDE